MMRTTFLAHSGFFVELDTVCLLFDWWKGELPELPDKPLLVFVSHRHADHFDPRIFALDDGARQIQYLLGSDFRLREKALERLGISAQTAGHCRRFGKHDCVQVLPGVTVETLPSTDEGVAFLVTVEGKCIFHAGDLNWWHWEGEPDPWNPDMAEKFRRFAEPLRGRQIDLAMLPLDPRLGEAGFWGPKYFLELAEIRKFLPMHQQEEFGFTDRFLDQHPQFRECTLPVFENGQQFELK